MSEKDVDNDAAPGGSQPFHEKLCRVQFYAWETCTAAKTGQQKKLGKINSGSSVALAVAVAFARWCSAAVAARLEEISRWRWRRCKWAHAHSRAINCNCNWGNGAVQWVGLVLARVKAEADVRLVRMPKTIYTTSTQILKDIKKYTYTSILNHMLCSGNCFSGPTVLGKRRLLH